MFCPLMVMDEDPELARFVRIMVDRVVESYVITCVCFATTAPMENAAVRVLPILTITLHCNDESDLQTLASQFDDPSWAV